MQLDLKRKEPEGFKGSQCSWLRLLTKLVKTWGHSSVLMYCTWLMSVMYCLVDKLKRSPLKFCVSATSWYSLLPFFGIVGCRHFSFAQLLCLHRQSSICENKVSVCTGFRGTPVVVLLNQVRLVIGRTPVAFFADTGNWQDRKPSLSFC